MRGMWLAPTAIVMAALAVAEAPAEAQAAVERALDLSADGWNAGDLDAFMAMYLDAPATSCVTTRGLLRGKAAIRASYAPRFAPGIAEKRCMLTMKTLDVRMIGPGDALMTAQYLLTNLDWKIDTGPTTLLFRHGPGGWRSQRIAAVEPVYDNLLTVGTAFVRNIS